jgi:SAM-dependent methyltransferase
MEDGFMATPHSTRSGSPVQHGFILVSTTVFFLTMAAAIASAQQAAAPAKDDANQELREIRTPDILFVPTPQAVVDKMLEMVKLTKNDLVYDLGCGDGRIVITAASKYGCHGVGYDIDPQRVTESMGNVELKNVKNLVRIEQKDVFTLDLSKANVVTLYLLPRLNVQLIPQLLKLKPGSRIVSHDFDMQGEVEPDQSLAFTAPDGSQHMIYTWIAPLKVKAEAK